MPANPCRTERHQAALDLLDVQLRRIVDAEDWAPWCASLARFRDYSPRSRLLIAAQRPDATRVATVATWNRLGRTVVKGETGIFIAGPKPARISADATRSKAPTDGAPPPAGSRRDVGGGTGYVFDVAQTVGDPLDDSPSATTLTPDDLAAALVQHCQDEEVTVERRLDMPQGMTGHWRPFTDTITLNAFHTHDDQAIALAHQLVHRHDPDLRAGLLAGDPRYYRHDRPDFEAVAEAAVATIAELFDVDTAATSGRCLAAWVAGDVDRLTALTDRVAGIVDTICPPHSPTAGVAETSGSTMSFDPGESKSNGQVEVDIGGVAGEAARRHAARRSPGQRAPQETATAARAPRTVANPVQSPRRVLGLRKLAGSRWGDRG